jgi:hypothetical protein
MDWVITGWIRAVRLHLLDVSCVKSALLVVSIIDTAHVWAGRHGLNDPGAVFAR